MHAVFKRLAGAAAVLAGLSGGAYAQVLVSADNNAVTNYSGYLQTYFPVDGTHTAVTFKTTVANEVVQFSFAAAICGYTQLTSATSPDLQFGTFSAGFWLDNGPTPGIPTGFGMCSYDVAPLGAGMQATTAGEAQARVVVPTPGIHTLAVTMSLATAGDNVALVFGQTHLMVFK